MQRALRKPTAKNVPSAYNTCCAKDEACKTTWNGRAYCVKNCPSNTTECNGWFDDVTDCCLGEEGEDFECEKVNGFHQCVYKDETACPAATIYCPGQTLSLCCPEGTVCSNSGLGAAVCTDVDGVNCSEDIHCGDTPCTTVGPDYAVSEVHTGAATEPPTAVFANTTLKWSPAATAARTAVQRLKPGAKCG